MQQGWLDCQQNQANDLYQILQSYYVQQNNGGTNNEGVGAGRTLKGRTASFESDSDWVPTPDFRNDVRSCNKSEIIVLLGPGGSGKTRAIQQSAKALNVKVLEWNYGQAVSPRDFLKQCLPSTTNKIMSQFFISKQNTQQCQQTGFSQNSKQETQIIDVIDVITPQKRKRPDQNIQNSNEKKQQQNNIKKLKINHNNDVCKKQASILQFIKQKKDKSDLNESKTSGEIDEVVVLKDETKNSIEINYNSNVLIDLEKDGNCDNSNQIITDEFNIKNNAKLRINKKVDKQLQQPKISSFFTTPEKIQKISQKNGVQQFLQQENNNKQLRNDDTEKQQNQKCRVMSENQNQQLNVAMEQMQNKCTESLQLIDDTEIRQNFYHEIKLDYNITLVQNSKQLGQGKIEQKTKGTIFDNFSTDQNISETQSTNNGALIVFEDAELLIQEDNKFLQHVQSQIQQFSSRPIVFVFQQNQGNFDKQLIDQYLKNAKVIQFKQPPRAEVLQLLEDVEINGCNSDGVSELTSSSEKFKLKQEIVCNCGGNVHWALNQYVHLSSVCELQKCGSCQTHDLHVYPFCGIEGIPVTIDALCLLSENQIDQLLLQQIQYHFTTTQVHGTLEDISSILETYSVCGQMLDFHPLVEDEDTCFSCGWDSSGQPSIYNTMAYEVFSVFLNQKDIYNNSRGMNFSDWKQQQDDLKFIGCEMDFLRKQFDSVDEMAYAAEIMYSTSKTTCNGRVQSNKYQTRKRSSSQSSWVQDKVINSNLSSLLKWRDL